MIIRVFKTQCGFALELDGGGYKSDSCEFRFPEQVWGNFSAKEALVSELAYVTTLSTPLLLGAGEVRFDTRVPRYLHFYNRCFEESIVNLVESIPHEDPESILERFRGLGRRFEGPFVDSVMAFPGRVHSKRAVLPFTFGKDSLASMAALEALGYEVIPVYVDERVLPRGERVRKGLEEEFARERGTAVYRVENEIQLLSDYQVLGVPETRLYQVQVHFIYVLSMLPFCEFFGAPWIVLSNEYQNTLQTLHRGGYLAPRRVMQSAAITEKLSRLAKGISGGQVAVANPIGGLGNFSICAFLHGGYPELGKYQLSCHLEVCNFERWCHGCDRCAQTFLFLSALGIDPYELGFEQQMLSAAEGRHYSLFREWIHPLDEYHRFTALEETVGFAAALERGVRGELVDRFAESFLPLVGGKLRKLKRKVFKVQRVRVSSPLEKEAVRLFQHVLSAYGKEGDFWSVEGAVNRTRLWGRLK